MHLLNALRRLPSSLLATLACVFALAGCSTTGNSFDSSALRFIVPGQTTLAEASSLLQADPTDVYRQQDGSAMARWSHKASMLTDAIYFNQELWLTFGSDGRFQRIAKSSNIPRNYMFEEGRRVDLPAVHASAAMPSTASSRNAGIPQNSMTVTPVGGIPAAVVHDADTHGAIYKPAVSYPLPQ